MLKKCLTILLVCCLVFQAAIFAEEVMKVDYDLTQMNSIMSFAMLSSIVDNPKAYAGKSFRMRGFYSPFRVADELHTWQMLSEADRQACCYTDGEVLLLYFFDKEQALELPRFEQLHEIMGTIEQADQNGKNVWALHVSSILPMDGTLDDVRWP